MSTCIFDSVLIGVHIDRSSSNFGRPSWGSSHSYQVSCPDVRVHFIQAEVTAG